MVKQNIVNLKQFTMDDVHNKNLVIEMLNYEEQLTKSDYGQSLYRNKLNKPFVSLTVEKALNRLTLSQFNFDTTDESVENYRMIFKTYYNSPTDYDADVLNAVHYMRNNKCMYYKSPQLNIGDKLPNCKLYDLCGENQMDLYDIINKKNFEYVMIGAFSLS